MEGKDKLDVNWEARYSLALLKRHARLYRNLDTLLTIITLFAGTAVAVDLFSTSSWLLGAMGVIVILATIIQFVIKPGEKRVTLKHEIKKYLSFLERLPSLAPIEAESGFWALSKDDSDTISGLHNVALHDTYLEIDGAIPPTALQLNTWNHFLKLAS
ncbi:MULTISPECIES: hypothetical protein [unclassified Halomonas]|uniref:hypothetical protein n=1 Tax=unclassified Halomonas TaxID=2609666 RepID=UPI00207691D7|nr:MULTISPECIES: hypothetical protein [unclassified Halomonas]